MKTYGKTNDFFFLVAVDVKYIYKDVNNKKKLHLRLEWNLKKKTKYKELRDQKVLIADHA